MNVFLTEPAEQYLRAIHEYYQFNVSVTDIVDTRQNPEKIAKRK